LSILCGPTSKSMHVQWNSGRYRSFKSILYIFAEVLALMFSCELQEIARTRTKMMLLL